MKSSELELEFAARGTSSGIVLYEITKQRRAFQERLRAKIARKKLASRAAI